jgi:hypothetical protein
MLLTGRLTRQQPGARQHSRRVAGRTLPWCPDANARNEIHPGITLGQFSKKFDVPVTQVTEYQEGIDDSCFRRPEGLPVLSTL